MENIRTALIAGATGLTGNFVLQLLLASENYKRVVAVTRKPLSLHHEKLFNPVISDFSELYLHKKDLQADDVYCCTGTTIKVAGTKEIFRKADYNIPVDLAAITKANGAKQFLLISSLGANINSLFFYNRIKGEVEEELKKMNFMALKIFRPSLITGERKKVRKAEEISIKFFRQFNFIFSGPLKSYAPIAAATIAKAMVKTGAVLRAGTEIFESEKIKELAEE